VRRSGTRLVAALGLILIASGTRVEAGLITHHQKTTDTELIAANVGNGNQEYKIINDTSSTWTGYDFSYVNRHAGTGGTVLISDASVVSGPLTTVAITNSPATGSAAALFSGSGLAPGGSFEVFILSHNTPANVGSEVSGTPSVSQPVVPEPSTIGLAATGALALAGVGWLRRQRP
jgi:hypothetical protein